MIKIFTDGSARGNPGPGGWGAIVARENEVTELGGRDAHTTNNRMEMTAAIRALESIGKGEAATLYTDSEYLLKGITVWIHGWQKNSWRTAAKKPVINQDLWEELIRASVEKHITWTLVRGHSGVPANERCDVIATSFADNAPIELYHGPEKEYDISLLHSGRA